MQDELVSVTVAADMSGVSDRTVRRWVAAGQVPAVSAPGGRLVRLVDVTTYAAQVAQQRTSGGQVSAGRPLSVEVSGRPADTAGQVSAAIVADLVATIQRQAEEIGVLRERLRALDAPHAAQDEPAAPQDSGDAPTPTARPVTSLRVRVLRWLRS